jgi:hypothetical protein
MLGRRRGPGAVGHRPRQRCRSKEEERERKRRKEKEKEGKEEGKREKKIGKRKRKIEKGRKKGFRKLGEILGKLGGRRKGFLRGGSASGVSVIFGTVVMESRAGRQDHDVRGISGAVDDSSAGVAGGGRRPECRRCRQDSRHARRGWEREMVTGV